MAGEELFQEPSGQGTDRFLLEGIQQAYWVGQSAALELSIPATYYVEAKTAPALSKGLNTALRRLVSRHDMLRATLLPSGEQQILQDVPPCFIPIEDWTALPPEERAQRADVLRQDMQGRDFVPGSWPQFDIRGTVESDALRLHMRFALWMMDGWSFRIFLDELLLLSADPDSELPPVAMSFADYVSAQEKERNGPGRQRAWEYWTPRLADFPGPPSLPLTRNLSPGQRPVFRHRSTRLLATEWAAIVEICSRRRITPSLLACSAYAEVLARYSGSRHFALTVLHSGRFAHLPHAADVFGNFGTTLLLEIDTAHSKPFVERTQQLQRQFWRDAERLEVSGIDVTRALQQRAEAAPALGIPVTFTAVGSDKGGNRAARPAAVEIDYDSARLEVPQVHLDHQLHLLEDGSAVFNWDYVEALFPKGFVDCLCDAHLELMAALARDESLWDRADADPKTLRDPDPARRPVAVARRLEAMFDERAIANPHHLAVIGRDATLTYGELRRRAHALASELRKRGAARDGLVAVCIRKGWEQVVAVLGILYAGAAYVPVDPDLPEERRKLLLASSEVKIALCTAPLKDALGWPPGLELLVVGEDHSSSDVELPAKDEAASDLAYVIFTSGSTGTPKGVMIDHCGAWNTIADLNERFGVGARDRILALSSLSFDLSVYDIFGALAAGATIVMPDAARTKDASHWRELIARHGVTIWNSVPALMQLALEGANGPIMPSLRLVMLSGDWIPLNLPDRIRPAAPAAEVISLGGATEASIWSNIFPIEAIDREWRSIPYGHAMEHQSIHVLDGNLGLCEPWVPGDIYIGGIGVAIGYWRDERKTAASFIIHPRTGQRLYRTGDLGRYLGNGEIEFLGRQDFQVKIQGFRVECAEVEAALLADTDIKAAVVSAAADSAGTRHLVAHVVPRGSDTMLDPAVIRRRLLAALPSYMVPAFFVVLPRLPLSDNGKVVRSALPKPDFGVRRKEVSAGTVAPRDELERSIADLWREVLGVPSVGRSENFFALGGSSFAGMRLAAKVEARLGRRLSFSALVSHPTVADMAALLRGDNDSKADSLLALLRAGEEDEPLFCIHPVGGDVACYMPLVLSLAPGKPIYGIRAPGLVSAAVRPLASIGAMAELYTAEALRVCPSGRCHLLGWSLGGLVVQDMARRLRESGRPAGLVAMIDSAVPREAGRGGSKRFLHFASDLATIAGITVPLGHGDIQKIPQDQRIAWLTDQLSRQGLPADRTTLERVYAVFEAGSEALATHSPQPFADRAELFLASDRPDAAEVAREWHRLMPRLHLTDLAADHYSIMREPAVGRIAAEIDRLMREPEGPAIDGAAPMKRTAISAGAPPSWA